MYFTLHCVYGIDRNISIIKILLEKKYILDWHLHEINREKGILKRNLSAM